MSVLCVRHLCRLVARLLVLALALGSCVPREVAQEEPSSGPLSRPIAPVLHHPLDELYTAQAGEPESIDPGKANDSASAELIYSLFAGLVDVDPYSLSIRPDVAISWDIDTQGRRYTFHLRPSRWSDGTQVTSHDFMAAVLRVLEPATGSRSASLLYIILGAEDYALGRATAQQVGLSCPDDLTFVVTLRHKTPYFLQLAAHSLMRPVPRHVFARLEAEHIDPQQWTLPAYFVSNGPFVVAQRRFKRDLTLERSPTYWDREHVALRRVHLMVVPNDNTLAQLYLAGELDWTGGGTALPPAYMHTLSQRDDFFSEPMLSTAFYWLNTHKPPLDDVRARQALSLAIDRSVLAEKILRGGQKPSATLVPPGMSGYPTVEAKLFDPARAKRLWLAATKGRPPLHLSLIYNTAESHRQVAEAIQQMWATHLGVTVELENQEWQVFLAKVETRDFSIARLGWVGDFADPTTFLRDVLKPFDGTSASGWRNQAFDTLMQQADAASDSKLRMRLLHDAEMLALDAQPLIPLYVATHSWMMRPWVRGMGSNMLGYHPLKDIYLRTP